VWFDWQVTLCDPHLSALEVRFSRRCAIQIDVYLYLCELGCSPTVMLLCQVCEFYRPEKSQRCASVWAAYKFYDGTHISYGPNVAHVLNAVRQAEADTEGVRKVYGHFTGVIDHVQFVYLKQLVSFRFQNISTFSWANNMDWMDVFWRKVGIWGS